MELVEIEANLGNVARLASCMQAPGADHDFAIDLIGLGICFVDTEGQKQPFFRFAPAAVAALSTS